MLIMVFAHFQITRTIPQQGARQPLGDTAGDFARLKGLDHLLLAAPHPHRRVAIGTVICVMVVCGVINRHVIFLFIML